VVAMPKVSEEYKKQKRNEILDYAVKLFAQKGFYQTTIDDIAKEAGVSKGAVYTYFSSKEEIFLALLDESTENLQKELAVNKEQSAEKKLTDLLDRFSASQLTEDVKQQILFQIEGWLYLSREERFRPIFRERWEKFHRLLAQIIKEGQQNGEFRRDVCADDVATWFLGFHDGISFHAMMMLQQEEYERTLKLAKQMLLQTIKG
jgi:AcrR family transcriptional regulator